MSLDKTVPLLADPQFCHAERRKCPGIGRPEMFFYLISCFKKYFPMGHLYFFPLYVDKCPLESVFNMNIASFPVSHYHFAWLKLESSKPPPLHHCWHSLFPTHGNLLTWGSSPVLCLPLLFSGFCVQVLHCLDFWGCGAEPALQVL